MTTFFDALTRHQIYLEAYKVKAGDAYEPTLRRLVKVVKSALGGIDDLGALTKAELAALLKDVKKEFETEHSAFIAGWIASMQVFGSADENLTRYIFDGVSGPRAAWAGDADQRATRLTDRALRETMGDTGQDPNGAMVALAALAFELVRRAIRAGRAQNTSGGGVIRRIVGTISQQFAGGLFGRLWRNFRTISRTAIQHISSRIIQFFGRIVTERYRWSAILDHRTSDICLDLNGRIFLWGRGPLPPAHFNCRSRVVPVFTGEPTVIPTLPDWVSQQPQEFVQDAETFGDFSSTFVATRGLTMAEILGRRRLLLAE